MIVLLIIVVGVILIGVVYIEHDRAEIQAKQEAIQKDLDALKECIKEEEQKRHDEILKRYDEHEGV